MKRRIVESGHEQGQPVFPGGIAGASLKQELARRELYLAHEVFPGGIAGASLKPATQVPTVVDKYTRFPRRNRRGLIEASCAAATAAGESPVFPGGIAGASLKPGGRAHPGNGRGRFPRRNRRGLIEASPTACWLTSS